MKLSLLAFTAFFIIPFMPKAQMVNGSAYIQGSYIEIGIDSLGGHEGSNVFNCPVPSGMHYRSSNPYFGFVANPLMDGWVNYDGDFYTPGSPENSWGFEFTDTSSTDSVNVRASNYVYTSNIPGSVTGYTNSSGLITVTWHGDYLDSIYDLDFDLVYELSALNLYYTTTMTITNNGPSNIEDFYYFRNIDPDNNQQLTGDYTTTNTVISQPAAGGSASVKAEQSLPWTSTFSFFTTDTNARVSKGGFMNRSGHDVWHGTGGLIGSVGATTTADEAVSLSFRQPGLSSFTRSGTSSVTFSFNTVFDGATLDSLTNAAATLSVVENKNNLINIFPNPASEGLNILSAKAIQTVSMFAMTGELVYTNTNVNANSIQVNTSTFSDGMYFVKTYLQDGSVNTSKIIKQ